MKDKLVIAVFVVMLSVPCPGAMNLVVAPWGSGSGQYGALFLPGGGSQGPQSLCIAEDGRLFVLDTFNGGRVIQYNAEGDLLGHIANEFPSAGYGEIEIEGDRFLFLLDLSRHAVNRIELDTQAQSFRTSRVLGASGGITLLGKDLRGKAFIRDSSGEDIALDPGYKQPLLTLTVKDCDKPGKKWVGWKNTRIEFSVTESAPVTAVRFLRQLATGEIFLGAEIHKNPQYQWRVTQFSPNGWTEERRFRPSPPSTLRYRKPVAVDRAGNVYEILCSPQDVRILKR